MKLNTTEDLYNFLEEMPSFQNTGPETARFDLERFDRFCEAIGKPHQDYPTIHVAGTNGKGSTCRILGAIYHEAGYKTGLFTSPHLMEYRERFQVGGECITDQELLEFFNEYGPQVESFELSYFELSTAIAFWWFSAQQVDLAIIEVGLGGRLDATNVITPQVSVITNISLDHTNILGDTISAVAKEKAGIIKPGVPVVTGNVVPQAREVIEKVAESRDSKVIQALALNPVWTAGQCQLTYGGDTKVLSTDLENPVQVYNIAVACQVTATLEEKLPVSEEFLVSGLKKVKSIFTLPGRFEKLDLGLEWYFDGAHNVDAVKSMINAVTRIKPVDQAVLVLSLMQDKINKPLMDEFQKFGKIYYYKGSSQRAAGIKEIRKWVPKVDHFQDEEKRLTPFLKELESELVIFAGSFYFYSAVRKWLQTLHPD